MANGVFSGAPGSFPIESIIGGSAPNLGGFTSGIVNPITDAVKQMAMINLRNKEAEASFAREAGLKTQLQTQQINAQKDLQLATQAGRQIFEADQAEKDRQLRRDLVRLQSRLESKRDKDGNFREALTALQAGPILNGADPLAPGVLPLVRSLVNTGDLGALQPLSDAFQKNAPIVNRLRILASDKKFARKLDKEKQNTLQSVLTEFQNDPISNEKLLQEFIDSLDETQQNLFYGRPVQEGPGIFSRAKDATIGAVQKLMSSEANRRAQLQQLGIKESRF